MNKLFILIGLIFFLYSCGGEAKVAGEKVSTASADKTSQVDNSQYREDVETVQNICYAFLEIFSGKAGDIRNWDRMRYLCLPSAQFNAVMHYEESEFEESEIEEAEFEESEIEEAELEKSEVKEAELAQYTLEGYIEQDGGWYDNTDIEKNQLGITIDQFGNMAQVFQVYEVIYDDQGDAGRDVGMMCYMLAFKNNRWHIANVLWETETEESKIAPEFYDEPEEEEKETAKK